MGPGELPVGSEVIPQDALMTISVSTDTGQWDKLREFGTPQSQAAIDQNLAGARDRILTANGFDYDRDIKPWIGREVTVAFSLLKRRLLLRVGLVRYRPSQRASRIRSSFYRFRTPGKPSKLWKTSNRSPANW